MKIFVDIDGTICCTDGGNYELSEPIIKNIAFVNELYDQGHEITYYTARGSMSGINWTNLTSKQLKKWGCKYHSLKMGKPAYDVFIDDKVINARDWENLGNESLNIILNNGNKECQKTKK